MYQAIGRIAQSGLQPEQRWYIAAIPEKNSDPLAHLPEHSAFINEGGKRPPNLPVIRELIGNPYNQDWSGVG